MTRASSAANTGSGKPRERLWRRAGSAPRPAEWRRRGRWQKPNSRLARRDARSARRGNGEQTERQVFERPQDDEPARGPCMRSAGRRVLPGTAIGQRGVARDARASNLCRRLDLFPAARYSGRIRTDASSLRARQTCVVSRMLNDRRGNSCRCHRSRGVRCLDEWGAEFLRASGAVDSAPPALAWRFHLPRSVVKSFRACVRCVGRPRLSSGACRARRRVRFRSRVRTLDRVALRL